VNEEEPELMTPEGFGYVAAILETLLTSSRSEAWQTVEIMYWEKLCQFPNSLVMPLVAACRLLKWRPTPPEVADLARDLLNGPKMTALDALDELAGHEDRVWQYTKPMKYLDTKTNEWKPCVTQWLPSDVPKFSESKIGKIIRLMGGWEVWVNSPDVLRRNKAFNDLWTQMEEQERRAEIRQISMAYRASLAAPASAQELEEPVAEDDTPFGVPSSRSDNTNLSPLAGYLPPTVRAQQRKNK
jgi:hypothetical protein